MHRDACKYQLPQVQEEPGFSALCSGWGLSATFLLYPSASSAPRATSLCFAIDGFNFRAAARKRLLSWFRRSEVLDASVRNELSTRLLPTSADDLSGWET